MAGASSASLWWPREEDGERVSMPEHPKPRPQPQQKHRLAGPAAVQKGAKTTTAAAQATTAAAAAAAAASVVGRASPTEPNLPSLGNGRGGTGGGTGGGWARGVGSTATSSSSLPPLVLNGGGAAATMVATRLHHLPVGAEGSEELQVAGSEEEGEECSEERLGLSGGSAGTTDEPHHPQLRRGSSLPSLVPSPRSYASGGRLSAAAFPEEEEPEPTTFEELVQEEMRRLEAEFLAQAQMGGMVEGVGVGVGSGDVSSVSSGGSSRRGGEPVLEAPEEQQIMDSAPVQPAVATASPAPPPQSASTSKAFGRGLSTLYSPPDEELAARRRQKLEYARALAAQIEQQQKDVGGGSTSKARSRRSSVGSAAASASVVDVEEEGIDTGSMTSLPIGELEGSQELAQPRHQQQQRRRRGSLLSLSPSAEEDEEDEAAVRRREQQEYARALDAQVAARRRQLLAGEAEGVAPLSPLSARRLSREEQEPTTATMAVAEFFTSSSPVLPAANGEEPDGRRRRKSEQQALYAAALREQMAEREARRRREQEEAADEMVVGGGGEEGGRSSSVCGPSPATAVAAAGPGLAALSQARRRLVHDVYGPQTSPWGNGAAAGAGAHGSPRLGPSTSIRAPPPTPASPAAALSAAAAAIQAEATEATPETEGRSGMAPRALPSFARHGAQAFDQALETSLEARQRQAAEQRRALESQMEEKRAREARARQERREEERRLLELLRRAEEAEAESLARRRRLQQQAAAVAAAAAAMAPVCGVTERQEAEEEDVNAVVSQEVLGGGSILEASSKFVPPGATESVASADDSRTLFPPIHPAALSASPTGGSTRPAAYVGMDAEAAAEEEEMMIVGTSAAVPIPRASSVPSRRGVAAYEEGPFEGSLASESTLLYLSSEEKRRMDAELRAEQAYWRERLQGNGGGAGLGLGLGLAKSGGNSASTRAVAALSPAAQMLVQEADALLERLPAATSRDGGDDKASLFELSGLSLGSLPDLIRRLGVEEEESSPLRDISNRPAAVADGGSGGKATTTAALAALLQGERGGRNAYA